MEYACAKLGRIFLLKFSDKDILLKELAVFAKRKRLTSAVMVFLGALRRGTLVTGPKKLRIPPQPNQKVFAGGWDVVGVGTIFTNPSGPQIHIHTAMGRKDKSLTGCVRHDSSVFLVAEAVVFELSGIRATKHIDPKTGINLLKIIS